MTEGSNELQIAEEPNKKTAAEKMITAHVH